MTTTDCPPLPVRITKSLLGYGVIAGPIYVVSVAAQAATRDGFDPTRHAASQLANGELGLDPDRHLPGHRRDDDRGGRRRASRAGARSAVGVGVGSARGLRRRARRGRVLPADPSDGFPPGTPPGIGEVSWHGLAHFAVAGLGFACLVAACFVLGSWFARNGQASWAWFSRITGLVFAGSFLALSSGCGRRRDDSGVHRGGRAGLGLAGRGVGQAVPVGGRRTLRVCSRDDQRWIVAPIPG